MPVGTADACKAEIQGVLDERGVRVEFDVVSNPEFLKEGAAVEDFMKPDRIIVGTDNPRTAELLRTLYEPFNRSRDRMIVMDVRSAELTKYAANAMLATKISFMNELANLAERVGADIEQVRVGIGSDPRIGYSVHLSRLRLRRLVLPEGRAGARRVGGRGRLSTPSMLRAVESVNERQKRVLFDKIETYFGGDLRGKVHRGLGPGVQAEHRRHARSRRAAC